LRWSDRASSSLSYSGKTRGVRSLAWRTAFGPAFALLSALGLRYPLAMLPLLFIQLLYKTLWLLSVYFPLRAANRSSDMALLFVIVVALDVIVIPWSYVFAQYVVRPGDLWRSNRRGSQRAAAAL
jgi:hypothetical protein